MVSKKLEISRKIHIDSLKCDSTIFISSVREVEGVEGALVALSFVISKEYYKVHFGAQIILSKCSFHTCIMYMLI